MTPFTEENAPYTLKEIAAFSGADLAYVRGVVKRLKKKPETCDKVKPLGDSYEAEYSAQVAEFIARRCGVKFTPTERPQNAHRTLRC